MYARCPRCQTLFRIRGAQLRSALGYVRCGACDDLFNALHTLSDGPDDDFESREPSAEAAALGSEQDTGPDSEFPEVPQSEKRQEDQSTSSATEADAVWRNCRDRAPPAAARAQFRPSLEGNA